MADKTSFTQSLMHMVKGNLGTGILAMPASFAHTGLVNGCIGLPVLCIVATYCVHILIKSTDELESRATTSIIESVDFDYANLAKYSFKSGPRWMRCLSDFMCKLVDGTLLIAQMGVCCVYLVFVVENITKILGSYYIFIDKTYVFMAIYPIALLLSYIKTLNRLAIASTFANLLQAIGISLILQYLIRDIGQVNLAERDNFRPLNEVALGFGSAMFAFEGVSVVLPIYLKLSCPERMSGWTGLINVAYFILLVLYLTVGLFGYLKFGHLAGDSITLNLPPTPLYDLVRAIFACSVFLTYPLQFYVPNEIVWTYIKQKYLMPSDSVSIDELDKEKKAQQQLAASPKSESYTQLNGAPLAKHPAMIDISSIVANGKEIKSEPSAYSPSSDQKRPYATINDSGPAVAIIEAANGCKQTQLGAVSSPPRVQKRADPHFPSSSIDESQEDKALYLHNYCCRTILVSITFALAMVVPKLNLLMDLIGSITGTSLSLIFPALIHIAAFWGTTEGPAKVVLVTVDSLVITFGLVAGLSGSVFSFSTIINSF